RSGAWNVLGRAQLVLGKRKDAIASFEKAVELNPESSYARNNLGLALIYDKRYEEAADSLEQAVELEPVEAYMWNNLGMAYEQLDRLDDARDAYDKAVAMDSDRAGASLSRLKGVTSVVRTARAETPPQKETPDSAGKSEASSIQ
ncbi:MAG: tetratricopeptide repeat protein, partial [Pseudomonadota bacterium]